MILGKRSPLAIVAVLAIVVSACGGTTATPSAAASPSAATPSAAPSFPTEYVDEVIPGMGAGLKIGYISGGDSIAFVKTVTEGLKEQATITGVDLRVCDSDLKGAEALKCAQAFSQMGLQAVVNWQFDATVAEAVCKAYGDLPTVSIDVHERPCEKTFTGIDNPAAGTVLGTGVGNWAKATLNCEYDKFVSIEAQLIKEISDLRMGPTKEAFAKVCGPIPADKLVIMSSDALTGPPEEQARKIFTDFLTANPAAKTIIVVVLSDPSITGVVAAAKASNRVGDVWMASHNVLIDEIRTNPQYVGSADYTPQFYGRMIMPVAIALAKGYATPPEVLLTASWVDKNNIDEFYPK